jgi:hypothetical protein
MDIVFIASDSLPHFSGMGRIPSQDNTGLEIWYNLWLIYTT